VCVTHFEVVLQPLHRCRVNVQHLVRLCHVGSPRLVVGQHLCEGLHTHIHTVMNAVVLLASTSVKACTHTHKYTHTFSRTHIHKVMHTVVTHAFTCTQECEGLHTRAHTQTHAHKHSHHAHSTRGKTHDPTPATPGSTPHNPSTAQHSTAATHQSVGSILRPLQ